jgi:hypothetical protein
LQLPDLPLPAERQVMLWFAPADIGPFTPPLCPSYRFERTDRTQYYGVPTTDGHTVKAARHDGGSSRLQRVFGGRSPRLTSPGSEQASRRPFPSCREPPGQLRHQPLHQHP